MTRERGNPNRAAARANAVNRRQRSVPTEKMVVGRSPDRRHGERDRPKHLSRPTVSWRQRTVRVLTDWRFFTLVGLSLTGGLTALSIAFIFKLPALPNCPAVFWPMASGSLRVHCAQLAANKETVPDLLEAIKLLNTLDKNHPLYPESSRLIEAWSTQILDLAEADFQAGKIKEAIGAAQQIPQNSSAAKLVAERIKHWETVWHKAEEIYNKAFEVLKKTNLSDARTYAARLLSVENEFWQSTKYEQLSQLITATHKDMTRMGKAENAMKSGVVDEIVTALQDISGIMKDSFVHKDAQELIPKMGRKLLDLAEAAMDRKDYNAALDIANRIPGNVNLGKEVDDFRLIAQAQSKAWSGGSLNLEDAIADAQRIAVGRPSYDKAQRLIARWQVEIKELAQLEQAKQLAQTGDLQTAIAQAASLSPSNTAAQEFLKQTTGKVQDQADRPILDQAEQLAMYGDVQSLEAAIAQAKQIGRGRSLHRQAQDRIQTWSGQLTTLRNQMARSESVTATSNPAATDRAMTPDAAPSNPAPSPDEAARSNERSLIQQASGIASAGTPDALIQAIGMVQAVPDSSPARAEALAVVDQWSQQMMQVAQSKADYDVPGAIAIVQRVPPGSSAYGEAQALLGKLRKSIGQ
jgi:tetratricopeptide (TPR) repeat protein